MGPDRALPYVTGLNDCAYLSWNSSSCTPVRPWPNPLYWPPLKFTHPGEDCAVVGEHADSQGSSGCQLTAYSFPWPLLPALALTEFCVPTPGSCHRHLQLAPTAKCVHTVSNSCPGAQLLVLQAPLRAPAALATTADSLQSSPRTCSW